MISRNVRCASVAFWNASKIFLSATVFAVFRSVAFHTMPYAPFPSFCEMSYFRRTCWSISSLIAARRRRGGRQLPSVQSVWPLPKASRRVVRAG